MPGVFFACIRVYQPLHHPPVRQVIHESQLFECTTRVYRYYNEARPRERSERGRFLPVGGKPSPYEPFFACRRKSLFIPGCAQGAIISLICLSVSASVCLSTACLPACLSFPFLLSVCPVCFSCLSVCLPPCLSFYNNHNNSSNNEQTG